LETSNRRDQVNSNIKSDKPAGKNDNDDPTINTDDPPAGLPDIGAPGLGGDEMPGGAITGGDGKAIRKEKKSES
jgi:hypothetical protein